MNSKPVLAMTAGLAAVGLAACGGGGSSSTTGSSSGSGPNTSAGATSSGVASARKAVAQLEQPPKPISLPALSKRPPAGKTVALVSCPVPGCKLAESSTIPAARLLGWKVKVLDGGLTPEKYVAAADQALQMNPDYIIFTALQPNATIQKELNQAKSRNIPVASFASSDPPGNGMTATIFGQHTLRALGTGLAQWVTADSNGKAKVVYLHDPSAASWKQSDATFMSTIVKLCPGCKVDQLQESDLNIGKSIPQQVVSYLQKNPDTQYVVTAFSARFLGAPTALKAAGFGSKVKLGSATSTPADYALTKANDPPYTLLAAEQEGGYRALDVFARLSVGDSIATCCTDPTLYEQLLTSNNVNSFNNKLEWGVPNLAKTFAGLWHVPLPPNFKTLSGVGG
jgi:ABC-type sugar transport system substrate-binding protein